MPMNSAKVVDFHTFSFRFSKFCKKYFWCSTIEPQHDSEEILDIWESLGDSYKKILIREKCVIKDIK